MWWDWVGPSLVFHSISGQHFLVCPRALTWVRLRVLSVLEKTNQWRSLSSYTAVDFSRRLTSSQLYLFCMWTPSRKASKRGTLQPTLSPFLSADHISKIQCKNQPCSASQSGSSPAQHHSPDSSPLSLYSVPPVLHTSSDWLSEFKARTDLECKKWDHLNSLLGGSESWRAEGSAVLPFSFFQALGRISPRQYLSLSFFRLAIDHKGPYISLDGVPSLTFCC